MFVDDPNSHRRPYDKWEAYGQAKTANALFAVGYDRHYGRHGIRANAVMPGGIMTPLQRHLTHEEMVAMGWSFLITSPGLTSQRLTVPSTTLSPSCGMRICTIMGGRSFVRRVMGSVGYVAFNGVVWGSPSGAKTTHSRPRAQSPISVGAAHTRARPTLRPRARCSRARTAPPAWGRPPRAR